MVTYCVKMTLLKCNASCTGKLYYIMLSQLFSQLLGTASNFICEEGVGRNIESKVNFVQTCKMLVFNVTYFKLI